MVLVVHCVLKRRRAKLRYIVFLSIKSVKMLSFIVVHEPSWATHHWLSRPSAVCSWVDLDFECKVFQRCTHLSGVYVHHCTDSCLIFVFSAYLFHFYQHQPYHHQNWALSSMQLNVDTVCPAFLNSDKFRLLTTTMSDMEMIVHADQRQFPRLFLLLRWCPQSLPRPSSFSHLCVCLCVFV